MGDVQLVTSIIAHPATVYCVVGTLVVWALASGWLFWVGTGKLASSLVAARSQLEKAKDFETVSDELADDPVLGPAWQKFRNSLVLPVDISGPVRATSRASTWFDLGLLRVPDIGVDSRYHAALPNLLVGAGLLFTFLGLAAALGTAGDIVGSEGQSGRTTALHALLDTASFKFITSLVGLFLSISYALFRKRRLQLVDRALDAFVEHLETRVPLMTPAGLQQEANEILRKQSTQFETFSTGLAKAMQRLADGVGARNEEAVQAMLDAFLQRLAGGASERMQEVVTSHAALGDRLETLHASLADAAARIAQSADSVATRMEDGAEAALSRINEQMGGLAETLRTVTDHARVPGQGHGVPRHDATHHDVPPRVNLVAGGSVHAGRAAPANRLAASIPELDRVARDAAAPRAGDLKAAPAPRLAPSPNP